MSRLTIWQRLSIAFAALLIAFGGASAWLRTRAGESQEQMLVQRLSFGLAEHIAGNIPLIDRGRLDAGAVKRLFDMTMAVNPSVEVYVLGLDGHVEAHAAPEGHVKLARVDTAPIARLLAGDPLPILGDDPRHLGVRKIFSAAPLAGDGKPLGYVYVVLLGEDRDALAARIANDSSLRAALWTMGLAGLLTLAAGLIAFALITRPLRSLSAEMRDFEKRGFEAVDPPLAAPSASAPADPRDEIAMLRQAFVQMAARIAEQWRELLKQDQQRRELVANVSHDLRTPLTSLHGYLETLSVKHAELGEADRRRYLETALAQSRKVGRLAQELFELARLEYGAVTPNRERFSLAELTYDVFQKFELAAEARRLTLVPDFAPGIPAVNADLPMIERVLTNLLDNAIRHTPEGGEIRVSLRPAAAGRVDVEVADSGPGIPPEQRAGLFQRPSVLSGRSHREGRGGLGLTIVQRILKLHESDIALVERPGAGAVFRFAVTAAER